MGYEEERLQILEMIERGVISAEEGIQLLNALTGGEGSPALEEAAVPQTPAVSQEMAEESVPEPLPSFEPVTEESIAASTASKTRFPPDAARFRSWWMIPLWVGVGIVVISALLMYLAYHSDGFGFWFACTWFPFLLGVAVLALAAASRTARWLHVRIQQKPGESPQRISISIPLPLRLTAWFFKTFRHRIPGLDEVPDNIDGLLIALEKATPEEPFYVQVDEGEDGEHVEVYIG